MPPDPAPGSAKPRPASGARLRSASSARGSVDRLAGLGEAGEAGADFVCVGGVRDEVEEAAEVGGGGGHAVEVFVEAAARSEVVGGVGDEDEQEVDRRERVGRVVAAEIDPQKVA